MRNTIIIIFCCLTMPFASLAAKNIKYPTFEIPEELKKNADAVIREYKVTKHIYSKTRVVTEEYFAVTIFNKSAQHLGYFYETYDDLNSISDYELIYYNQVGIETSKAKKNDFKDVSNSGGSTLYDDQRLVYYNAVDTKYPYTISYKVTHTNNQSLFLGDWYPVPHHNVAVEKASLEIISEDTSAFRFLELNMPTEGTRDFIDNKYISKWELNNFKAIDDEPYSPSFFSIAPSVRIAPNQFKYDGTLGDLSSWQHYGKWAWELSLNRDELEEATHEIIKTLVANCETDQEKIEKIYQYLQDNTRYVNVSLGIGGFQPSSAEYVNKNKYGDCKALSNYMLSLLKIVDIPSNLVLIKSGNEKHIIPYFPSQQMNHMILCVPNKGDTLWLECTSQKIPFAYISRANHNKTVLLITDEGGKIAQTKKYNRQDNTQNGKIKASIDSLGNINLISETNYKAIQYENVRRYFYMSREEQKEELLKDLDIPRLKINDFDISRIKKPIPEATGTLDLSIAKYAKITGSRIMIAPNILNRFTNIPSKTKDRQLPILGNFDFEDTDTVSIDYPENLNIEYLPESITIDSEFGYYKCTFAQEDQNLMYTRCFYMDNIDYPKEKYEALRSFMKQVARADQSKVIFTKALK